MDVKKYLKGKKIGVLYGGRSAEREISLLSGNAVLKALAGMDFDVVGIDAQPNLPLVLKKEKIDFAYIALHGPWGEDGTVQGMLEIMGIPYSGCGVLASAACMDKSFSKRVFDSQGLPTAVWLELKKGEKIPQIKFFPAVVKPVSQGSAIGVSIVNNKSGLKKALKAAFSFGSRAIIEKYIKGTEITVGILGGKALPVVEIVPEGKFYDFNSKYEPGKSRHLMPPRLPKKSIALIKGLGLKAFRALGCRAVSRIDMIVDSRGKPWILEINTIPGMTETSLLPDEAKHAGLSFGGLILEIIGHSLGSSN